MKTCLRLIWVSLVLLSAQVANSQIQGGYAGQYGYNANGFQPMTGDLNIGMPGRVWIGANYADEGLGYTGSYLTLGMKTRLGTDRLDGRWLFEARGHYSVEADDGGFFGNFGVERVVTIAPAGADVSLGFWADYDGDQQGAFANEFAQVGVSGAIKTRRWDLVGNGYFPVGTTDYVNEGPAGFECFVDNNIALTPAFNSALRGFDATLNLRPAMLGMVNGTVGIGGYGYSSELIEHFGGFRVRTTAQVLQGMILTAEVNHDDRFDTTGVVGMSWMFGVNARGAEYAGLGRDLQPTLRNDHIVRIQNDVVLAINPDTGLPYNVIHVDNTADPAFENGTINTPFRSLSDAEAASSPNDMIFVHRGDGTASFQDQGIVLQPGQYLLGAGVQHIIPIQDGLNFVLCNPIDGLRPVISASGRNNAIELSHGNTVRGFVIDGLAGTGGMANGIFGDGFNTLDPLRGGVIEDTQINNALLNGVHLLGIEDNWTFARNNFDVNAVDGLLIEEACDPTSIFTFEDNTFNTNGFDGLHMRNYDAAEIVLRRNETNDNGRDGIRLENFKNGSGNGLTLDLLAHSSTGNNGFGVNIIGGDGALRVINGNLQGNAGGGLRIEDWTNSNASDSVFIGPSDTGFSDFSNNGAGVGIEIILNSGTQRLVINETTSDNNLIGLRMTTNGVGTFLDADILDNISFSNNLADGIRSTANGGSSQLLLIDQPTAPPPPSIALQLVGNGFAGINLLAGNNNSGVTSVINARLDNMLMTGNAVGLNLNSNQDGQIILDAEDFTLTGNGVGVNLAVNNNNNGALNQFDFVRMNMDNNLGGGFNMLTQGGSLTAISITDSLIDATQSTFQPTGPPNFMEGVVLGNGTGVGLVATGANNMTLLQVQGNTINNQDLGGIVIDARQQADVLATIVGNQLDFNGFGNGDGGGGTGNAVNAFQNGIAVTSQDNSRVSYEMQANVVNNSFEFGVLQATAGNGTINALWNGNVITGNDIADDTNTMAPENNGIDILVLNGSFTANTCLALTSNLFNNEVIVNAGLPPNFILEVDGTTNGTFTGPVANTQAAPFGSTCEPAIDAVKAAFDAAGFPPTDHN